MKKALLTLIFILSFVGCSFLKGAPDGEDAEELSFLAGDEQRDEFVEEENGEEEDEMEGDEWVDDEEDEEDEESEDGDEDDEGDDDESEEDDDEEEDESDDDEEDDSEDDEDEDEDEDEKKGFFSRIFGWGDDDSDDDEMEDDEMEDEEDEEDLSDEDGEMESGEDFDEEGYGYDSSEDSFDTEEKGEEFSKADSTPSEQPVAEGIDETVMAAKPPQKMISLKKIRRQAYKKGVYLVNAVYIARKGDTIGSISQKIYNSDQKAALYIMNPHLRSRSVKVGDKIYYGSSRRPQDASEILIYYEELGIPPKTHLISSGENIRSVSKNLLGHENSWKEIWATNPDIVSKGLMSEAVELKYWPNEALSTAAPPVEESYEEEEVSEDIVEDTGEMEASDDISAEEEGTEADEGEGEGEGEGDSSDDEVISAPVDIDRKKKMAEWVIIVGIFLLILLSLVALVIKKKRGRREFDYTSTNIQPLS